MKCQWTECESAVDNMCSIIEMQLRRYRVVPFRSTHRSSAKDSGGDQSALSSRTLIECVSKALPVRARAQSVHRESRADHNCIRFRLLCSEQEHALLYLIHARRWFAFIGIRVDAPSSATCCLHRKRTNEVKSTTCSSFMRHANLSHACQGDSRTGERKSNCTADRIVHGSGTASGEAFFFFLTRK